VRIAKAVREGRYGKAKALRWLLTHSYYARLLAVKRVTSDKGKKTPGIIDKCSRVFRQGIAFEMPEPCALKGASTVLRELGAGNSPRLLDFLNSR